MKQRRPEREERRRPLVEANLLGTSKTRSSWPPRPKLSSYKKVSEALARLLGRR